MRRSNAGSDLASMVYVAVRQGTVLKFVAGAMGQHQAFTLTIPYLYVAVAVAAAESLCDK
jgi:hypothetical protein